jgi:hypothetical protein
MSARSRKDLAARGRVLKGALRGVLGGAPGDSRRSPGSPHPGAFCGAVDLPRSPRHIKVDH